MAIICSKEFADRVQWFCDQVTKAIELDWKYDYNDAPKVMMETDGHRYIKLATFEKEPWITGPYKAKHVYCFIDKLSGDVLKGSWKAPVKNGVRGNLFDKDILDKVTTYGAMYLRGGNMESISTILKTHQK